MRKLIWLITIVAAAGGGYWLGQRPNSPLIFEWAGRQIEEFDNRGGTKWIREKLAAGREQAAAALSPGARDSGQEPRPESRTPPAEKARPIPQTEIPQCW